MSYDPLALSMQGMKDQNCSLDGACIEVSVPPLPLWPQGHAVSIVPEAYVDWVGSGIVIIANFSGSGEEVENPISEAYLSGGAVVGDSEAGYFVYEFLSSVPNNSPTAVTLFDVVAVDEDAIELETEMQNSILVVDP